MRQVAAEVDPAEQGGQAQRADITECEDFHGAVLRIGIGGELHPTASGRGVAGHNRPEPTFDDISVVKGEPDRPGATLGQRLIDPDRVLQRAGHVGGDGLNIDIAGKAPASNRQSQEDALAALLNADGVQSDRTGGCLLYTSPSPRD